MQKSEKRNKRFKTRLVGPNCPGVLTPGSGERSVLFQVIFVNLVELVWCQDQEHCLMNLSVQTSELGQSTIIGIGGDPVNGTNFVDALELFLDDPETDGIVLIGEIGGTAEIDGANFIKSWKDNKKPVLRLFFGSRTPKEENLVMQERL